MSFNQTLFSGPIYIELPEGWLGWLGWLFFVSIIAWLLYKWRGYHQKKWTGRQWGIFIGLAVLLPLTSLFFVLRLPATGALPPPGKPVDPRGPALVIFAALPWELASGFLGPAPAALFGMLSGLALALWDTHNPFTLLELALAALLLSVMINQRYRTLAFRALRHPLVASVLLALLYPFLCTVDSLFVTSGSLANRLDYTLSHAGVASLAIAGQMLVGGLFSEAAAFFLPALWGNHASLLPSPAERKLETRFLYTIASLSFIMLAIVMVGDWVSAGQAATQMIRERLASTAETASETVPFFLDSGQSLIRQLSQDPLLYNNPSIQMKDLLSKDLRSVPFFNQLYLLDEQGNVISGYPFENYNESPQTQEETAGINLALKGVPVQTYTISPAEGESAARVSFLAAVTDDTGKVRRVLIGRVSLATNPFTEPIIANIRNVAGTDGEGMLLDGDGRILYHPNPTYLMQKYTGRVTDQPDFYDEAAPDGTRRLVYYQPVSGNPWSVVLSVPARRAQQLALNIALPMLALVLGLFVLIIIMLRVALRVITASLHSLSIEAQRISSGQLDNPLDVKGEDEVGQMRRAFEQMRISLKSRLEELNRLLLVSRGVASSLEMKEAVKPVLESVLSMGACSARVVLSSAAVPKVDGAIPLPTRFGMGPSSEIYSCLDKLILEMVRKQETLMLNNLASVRLLNLPTGVQRPKVVLALGLYHENLYYGSLWMAYDHSHLFDDDEIRFLETLAGQTAMAAANARLFQNAEIGRQRLAAILASTPDPVLVTDYRNYLLLSNPAAWQVLGLGAERGGGQPIEKVTTQKDLLKLLRATSDEKQSAEVTLVNGRIYLATASSIITDGQRMGRVCVLRDITHFKELDAMKSEFVATVSHDLRSPLNLMRGYATMLEMMGELNDQQNSYVKKIIIAVENMSRLVNNLLDLGRIEAGVGLQLEIVLVHDIVEKVTSSLQLQANQKHIQLNAEIPSQTVPLIEADPALLHQALYNLVENAIKYTDANGAVTVKVLASQGEMTFVVSDTGIGIAPVDQQRLFEKFFRGAQRETRQLPGSGLGLAIVKSIAERHSGRVWVESHLGKGSTFYLVIPLRQVRQDALGVGK
jgi:PAS domain S-box-containing protein